MEPLENVVYVLDTGPLIRLATGFPFKFLSAVSFLYNDYRKAKNKAWMRGVPLKEMASLLRRDLISQVEGKYKAGLVTLAILGKCMEDRAVCVLPRQVHEELERYSEFDDIRDTLRLLGSRLEQEDLVREYNRILEEIGRGEGSRKKQVVPLDFFRKLVGNSLSMIMPDLETLDSPIYQKWLNIIRALTSSRAGFTARFRGLSETDKQVLAYTAYLNSTGRKAVAVIGDNTMKKLADFLRIPYVYVYEGVPRVHNYYQLGQLQLKPIYGSYTTEEKNKLKT